MNKFCVRCGRPPHPDRLYLDCLYYIAPAPLRLRLFNRIINRINKALGA